MPFNPSIKIQSNHCEEIIVEFLKHDHPQQLQKESLQSEENVQIAEGKWEDDQNLKFLIFIDFHSKIFASKQRRKTQKIFKSLSKYLGNRTPSQCRSHYQKVMMRFKTIAKLKKHSKEHFGHEFYNQNFKQFEQSCKQNHKDENQSPDHAPMKETKQIETQTEPVLIIDDSIYQMMLSWQILQWNMSNYSHPYNF